MSQVTQRRWLCRGALPEQILDYLTTHGGWHTTANLLALSDSRATWLAHPVRRALFRLRDRGLIEARPTDSSGRFQPQNEWRATDRAWEYL